MLQPELTTQYLSEGMKYEDVFVQVCQAVGATFILGGVLIVLNRRVVGGVMCLLALGCVMATQDNPFIIEFVKPRPQS